MFDVVVLNFKKCVGNGGNGGLPQKILNGVKINMKLPFPCYKSKGR